MRAESETGLLECYDCPGIGGLGGFSWEEDEIDERVWSLVPKVENEEEELSILRFPIAVDPPL